MSSKREVVEQIKSLMEELDVSAYKLSKDTGISEAGIGKIINGKSKSPQDRTLELLLNSLLNYKRDITARQRFEEEKRKLAERAVNIPKHLLHKKSSIELFEDDPRLTTEFLNLMLENRELLKEISKLKDRIIEMQNEQNAIKSTDHKSQRKTTPELTKK